MSGICYIVDGIFMHPLYAGIIHDSPIELCGFIITFFSQIDTHEQVIPLIDVSVLVKLDGHDVACTAEGTLIDKIIFRETDERWTV